MKPDYSKEDRWYIKNGVAPPEHSAHGTPDEIRANLKPAKVTKWHLDGNKLVAETELGPVVNYLPPEYILRGVDESGLPILTKLVL